MADEQYIIGVTGGSGVGKTTLINILNQKFKGKISSLSLDDYYLPKEQQAKDRNGVVNFDLPNALDTVRLEKDLKLLQEGNSIHQKAYHFNQLGREEEFKLIEPNHILLVEGLFVMHYTFVKSMLDYKVFIEVNVEKQLQRRLKRDLNERNYSQADILYQWENHVLPAYQSFVLPYKEEADLVINNEENFDLNLEVLVDVINAQLKGSII